MKNKKAQVPWQVILFLIIIIGFAIYTIYDFNNVSPREYCNAVFFTEDPYFISSYFNKDTGELRCTIDKQIKETRIFDSEHTFWTGIHVRPK